MRCKSHDHPTCDGRTRTKVMKIAFAGASGQGKTTTAEGLLSAPEFMHFDFVKSNIRAALDAGYGLNEEATRLSQLLILSDKVGEEAKYNGHSFVTDRTPIDFFAHVNVINKNWDDYYYNVYQNLVIGGMQQYTHVFYFPFVLEVDENKYRSTDPKFHKRVDKEIQALLRDFEVPYTYMPNGSVEERVDFIRFKLWKEKYK